MAELLLEVGVEELPVSFVSAGLASLESAAKDVLEHHRLPPTKLEVAGTPRRLALLATLPDAQASRSEQVTGPPWSAAFKDGEATRAATGFARKHGVDVSALLKVPTDKGDYVGVQIDETGRPAAEVLQEALMEVCRRISFPKVMRWGEGEHAFGRPVQWLVSLLDDAVVDFEFAGVRANRTSRGHRFLAPETRELAHANDYASTLKDASVLVRTAERTKEMEDALHQAAEKLGGTLVRDAFLIEECATLVEKPFVVPGSFDARFLELPEAVVVSVMRDHQRYFAVRGEDGKLLPRYLNVANTAERPELIAEGNDRVLRARLADAWFFVEEDRKSALETRLAKLDSVVFHRKLGTVGQKVARIEKLAASLSAELGVDEAEARKAARLAKADLETLIVFEFPELQGEMGAYYARAEGLPGAVCSAIEEHYKPVGTADSPPSTPLGALIAMADRADTLVGCFGVGLIPKGNRDPFALRRAAVALMRIATGPIDVNLRALFDAAYTGFGDEAKLASKEEVLASLDEFVRARLLAHYREHVRTDVVQAAMAAWDGGSLRDLKLRIEAVEALRGTDAFLSLTVAFKRAFNITKDAERRAIDEALLEDGAERALFDAFSAIRDSLSSHAAEGEHERALRLVAESLRGPIDTFFDEVFVMADDPSLRANRLALLGAIADAVSRTVHFHRIAGDAHRPTEES